MPISKLLITLQRIKIIIDFDVSYFLQLQSARIGAVFVLNNIKSVFATGTPEK